MRIYTPITPYEPTVPVTQPPVSTEISKKKQKKNKKQKKSVDGNNSVERDSFALAYLRCFLNPVYLTDDAVNDISDEFVNNSSIQLGDFLREDLAEKIEALAIADDTAAGLGQCKIPPSYEIGAVSTGYVSDKRKKPSKSQKSKIGTGEKDDNGRWTVVGPPHKRRYLLYEEQTQTEAQAPTDITINEEYVSSIIAGATSLGSLLAFVNKHLFKSSIFNSYFLPLVTNCKVTGSRGELRRFRPGLDYTVAHFGMLTEEPKLDCTLCFAYENTDDADNREDSDEEEEEAEADDSWEGGDVGGFECYVAAEDDAAEVGASEVYQVATDSDQAESTAQKKTSKKSQGLEDENELLSISAGFNVLSIVVRDEKVMKFVKYINTAAPGSRWDITAEYEFEN